MNRRKETFSMKPINKVNMYVFAITTSIAYSVWKNITILYTSNKSINLLLTFTLSYSFYKLVYNLLSFLCNNCRQVRKKIFGKYYLEGVWVGFYIYNGTTELCYETIEQTLEHTTLKGRGFDKDGNYISSWIAIEPLICLEESKLTYYYELNELNYDDIAVGLARATIEWNKHKKACRCEGFAIDGETTKKQFFLTVKENDNVYDIQDNDFILQNSIISRAKEIYENNKNIFIKSQSY